MASKKTLYTTNEKTRVVIEAWKTNLILYNSIGSKATVYREKVSRYLWWTVKEWVKHPADTIQITNEYEIPGPFGPQPIVYPPEGPFSWHNTPTAELSKVAFGMVGVTIRNDGAAGGSLEPLNLPINKIKGTIMVKIGQEMLGDVVDAG